MFSPLISFVNLTCTNNLKCYDNSEKEQKYQECSRHLPREDLPDSYDSAVYKVACLLWDVSCGKYHARSVTIIRERVMMPIKTLSVVTKAAR